MLVLHLRRNYNKKSQGCSYVLLLESEDDDDDDDEDEESDEAEETIHKHHKHHIKYHSLKKNKVRTHKKKISLGEY